MTMHNYHTIETTTDYLFGDYLTNEIFVIDMESKKVRLG